MADRNGLEAREISPPVIDFMDPATQECPYAAYATLRKEAPVYKDPGTGFFVITRYNDLRAILLDTANYSAERRKEDEQVDRERAERIARLYQEKGWLPAPTLLLRDDPNHAQLRAVFEHAFRPSTIKALDPFVESTADRLISAFIDDGRCDIVQAFAIPFPLIIIGRQMGVPDEDIWMIKRATQAWVARTGLMLESEDEIIRAAEIEIGVQHYFQPMFERLRKQPDGSLLSELVNRVIPEWGRTLNDNELHAEMMADTFVGGSETTTNAFAAGVRLLAGDPDSWQTLKRDPDRHLRTFVEEVLRLESPVQGRIRVAKVDIELHGLTIPAGSLINVRFGAANRDEAQFPDPDRLDLSRRNAGSHLAFSSGIHHCLGAPLARRELYWAFRKFVERIGSFRVSGQPDEITHVPNYWLRGLSKLAIEFTKA